MDVRSPKRQRSDSSAGVDSTAGSIPVASLKSQLSAMRLTIERRGIVSFSGSVLFKIHRLLLERETSAFSNMFNLPQGNTGSQVNSDENPLVLHDDVNDFRALCWILYALPTEYSQQHSIDTANIQKLVSLFLISHKYHFEAHETFARDLLAKHCSTFIARHPFNPRFLIPRQRHYFNRCPESRLEAILRIVILTEQTFELPPSLIQKIWKNRLKEANASISYALGVGEALGLREFVGELYYIELTRMKPMPLEGSPAYVYPVISALEPHQKLALYQGSLSLRWYWSNTLQMSRSQLEQFKCDDDSDGEWHHCLSVWREGWKEVDYNGWDSRPFDPLKEMSKVVSRIMERGHEEGSWAPCALPLIAHMQECLEENIADHFLGPPLPISTSDVEASL
ncbi:hypothetical protein BJ912DRAFT_2907 [Pholiota molesta]|nr:hypothetical protein BJ912DRAFT_2907 [Pholiota molesta]